VDGSGWGSGGFAACDIPLLDVDPLSRSELRKCAMVIMAGIAAELVLEPSLSGKPHPWSGHSDAAAGNAAASGLPTDVTLLTSYIRHTQPPIEDEWTEREILRGFRSATAILARRTRLIRGIADAIGAAYNDGEARLSEEQIRIFLGRE
jgi:hypothetical protein